MNEFRNVIVIGASAGGMQAIAKVLVGLDRDIDATVLIVLHLSDRSNSANIAQSFQRHTELQCEEAREGVLLQRGHLYVAVPGHHLMVNNGRIRITPGAYENKHRPSIDVLFRSAAVHYGHRVIGIILTGMLEDGTSGMVAIKKCGGLCIVQDPAEAKFSDMPTSVLNKVEVDHKVGLDDMPQLILGLLRESLPPQKPIPETSRTESRLAEKMASSINELKQIADPSDYTCPDCGGGLWAVKDDLLHRYRCHTGHVYTERLLQELQDKNIEESVWVSIRMLEEKANMLLLIGQRAAENNDQDLVERYRKRARDVEGHVERLKVLLSLLDNDDTGMSNSA